MDHSEELAFEYLKSLGVGPIIYEPDGNVPPDFLLGDRIAVEVRRLNEHFVDSSGKRRGLEDDQFALERMIKNLVLEIGPPTQGKSWFVVYDFHRPLMPLSKLRRAVWECLIQFRESNHQDTEFSIGRGFSISLIPASNPHPTCFLLGGYSDDDSGGFLIGLLEDNIRHCIEEKCRKIARFRKKYPEWWLLLIDRIGYGAWEPIRVQHNWDRVVLLDPQNPSRTFELNR